MLWEYSFMSLLSYKDCCFADIQFFTPAHYGRYRFFFDTHHSGQQPGRFYDKQKEVKNNVGQHGFLYITRWFTGYRVAARCGGYRYSVLFARQDHEEDDHCNKKHNCLEYAQFTPPSPRLPRSRALQPDTELPIPVD